MKHLIALSFLVMSFNAMASEYCKVVPQLHSSELTEMSVQAGQGVPGSVDKLFSLLDISESLAVICGDSELSYEIGEPYCEVVPELNAKELERALRLEAQGIKGAKEKASALIEIEEKLVDICKK